MVLVACEESGRVTEALRKFGVVAYSCDISPTSGNHPEWHLQGKVEDIIGEKRWRAVIGFPPCTHLASSGARLFKQKRLDGRQNEAITFFLLLTNKPIFCIENPIGIMSSVFRKPGHH